MNSKLCIVVVIALCLTLVHAGGKYCPEPKRKGPCHMRYKDNQCRKTKTTVQRPRPPRCKPSRRGERLVL
uniref:U21-Sparatoxin-Hju1x_1 n=1 Tax=Heteropoda jugulans TaxID=1358901 RepID=A0A4Q8KC33_9ARAC